MLVARDYKLNIVNECIRKARAVPRKEALKDVIKEVGNPRPVFVVLYDPRMPSVSSIVTKHWRTMVNTDPYLREVFPAPPLIAYKVGRNLGSQLIRARIPRPAPLRERRLLNGMHRCNKKGRGCPMCCFVFEVRIIEDDESHCHWGYCRDQGGAQLSDQGDNLLYYLQKMFDVICWHKQTQCTDKTQSTCGLHQEQEPESTNWETFQLKGPQII